MLTVGHLEAVEINNNCVVNWRPLAIDGVPDAMCDIFVALRLEGVIIVDVISAPFYYI